MHRWLNVSPNTGFWNQQDEWSISAIRDGAGKLVLIDFLKRKRKQRRKKIKTYIFKTISRELFFSIMSMQPYFLFYGGRQTYSNYLVIGRGIIYSDYINVVPKTETLSFNFSTACNIWYLLLWQTLVSTISEQKLQSHISQWPGHLTQSPSLPILSRYLSKHNSNEKKNNCFTVKILSNISQNEKEIIIFIMEKATRYLIKVF